MALLAIKQNSGLLAAYQELKNSTASIADIRQFASKTQDSSKTDLLHDVAVLALTAKANTHHSSSPLISLN